MGLLKCAWQIFYKISQKWDDSKRLSEFRKKRVKLTKIIKNNYLQAKDISILYDLKKIESENNRNKKIIQWVK